MARYPTGKLYFLAVVVGALVAISLKALGWTGDGMGFAAVLGFAVGVVADRIM